ncbi:MAG: hypothetical protein AAFP07_01655 [Cyanobacteria bacterium J06606_4]
MAKVDAARACSLPVFYLSFYLSLGAASKYYGLRLADVGLM